MSENEDYCMLCGRPSSVTGSQVLLPGNIRICTDCMQDTLNKMNNGGMLDPRNMMGFSFPGIPTPPPAGTPSGSGKEQNPEPVPGVILGNSDDEPEEGPDTSEDDKPEEKSHPSDPFGLGQLFGGNGINIFDMTGGFGGQKAKVKRRGKDEPLKPLIDLKDLPAPHLIKEQLDEYVIGQEKAKKILSVAVYNHYKRVATGTMDDIEIEKSNMLMIGPTGSGKTFLVKTLARLLDVPLAIADATSLTEAGYIGDDIESVISKLLAAADNDVDKAEQGIVFIDEIDKIAKKANTNSRDVSGESVQQGMLKLLEGADVEVPVGASSKGAMVPLTTVNTRNILFICGGAFDGITDIIRERVSKDTGMGFASALRSEKKEDDLLPLVTVEDLRKFGMIPEFLGRLPVIYTLSSLDLEMLVRILSEPKNAILKQYQKLLALDEVDLKFTDDALEAIAEEAKKKDTGARALRSIIEEFMLDIMYEIPKDDNIGTVTITGDYIRKKGGPIIELRG